MPILAVAPHWGAWIEILVVLGVGVVEVVAPHWGAWIEIATGCAEARNSTCRTPLGCVD